jgi:hypothetical protein
LAAEMESSVLADSNAFSINGFTGLSNPQIISFFIVFVIFNGYVVLEAAALMAFYVTSKPRHGHVRTAAIWHFFASLWFVLAFISTVWSAPAEKTFMGSDGVNFGIGQRAITIFIGFGFAAIGVSNMLYGFALGARQKREIREEVYATV